MRIRMTKWRSGTCPSPSSLTLEKLKNGNGNGSGNLKDRKETKTALTGDDDDDDDGTLIPYRDLTVHHTVYRDNDECVERPINMCML